MNKNHHPYNGIAFAVVMLLFFAMTGLLQNDATAGEKVGGVDVSVLPSASMDNVYGSSHGISHGYSEIRVRLKNLSTQDQVVQLSYPSTHDRPVTCPVTTREVRVAAGQEAAVSLFQTALLDNDMLEVRVDGSPDYVRIPAVSLYEHSYGNPPIPAVLLSRNIPQEFRDEVHPASTPPPPGGGSPSPERATMALLRSELPVGQWSENWLGYSCFDAILMTDKDAEELPQQVQLALRRYLECGGAIVIHGNAVPAAFSQGGDPNGSGGFYVGFGRVTAVSAGSAVEWKATHEKLKQTLHVYRPNEKPTNLFDLLVANATVPVRGLFVLVLLFGVGIGPANLLLLSRFKRRIWLWWNVPAISALTCLLVFGYAFASEGFMGHGRKASMTLLDQRAHRAATIGYVSYYCPLTPSAGAHFSVDTEATLLDNDPQPWRRYGGREDSNQPRFVDWTADQHMTSGWINARVPAYFQIRKNEDRRERLSVEKQADGSLKIVNALGADIRHLSLADASGRVFEGHDIPAGAERILKATADTIPSSRAPQAILENIFTPDTNWLNSFDTWRKKTTFNDKLSPSSYVAVLDKSPFVESPLEDVDSEDTAAIVYGIMKEQPDGR